MMLALRGKTRADFHPASKVGKLLRAQGVQRTPELERIVSLPRRRWQDEDLAELSELLESVLRLPGSTMRLRPIQAVTLRDAFDFGGCLGPIRVGGGKTLVSFLAPSVLEVSRALLVVPAKLREKTRREFAKLAREWVSPPRLELVSYEELGRTRGAQLLEELEPELVILDEAQKVKNPRAAVTKRLARHFEAHPETRCIALSGTITQRSLRDFAHIAAWCLPRANPVPQVYNVLTEWAQAVDEKLPPEATRLRPGALEVLYNEEERALAATSSQDPNEVEEAQLAAVRRAFRRRLVETPGVVATEDGRGSLPPLILEALEAPERPAEIERAFAGLRDRFELPDGQLVVSPADAWRHARELALGFYYRWKVPGPPDWMEARRRWGVAVRHVLAHNRRGLDSEAPVAAAAAAGDLDETFVTDNGMRVLAEPVGEVYRAWAEIRPTFVPETEAVWLDDSILELVARWMEEAPGIVFCDLVAFAAELSRRTGRPYHRQGGRDATGVLLDAAAPEAGSVVASLHSSVEGWNLQAWSRALVVSAPPKGDVWEQLLGRLHRDGQEAEEVTFSVLVACREHVRGFAQAVDDARYIQDAIGQEQKLCYADRLIPPPEELASRPGSMW